jgi:hypothetical protein
VELQVSNSLHDPPAHRPAMVVRHRACLRGLGLEESRLLGQQTHT